MEGRRLAISREEVEEDSKAEQPLHLDKVEAGDGLQEGALKVLHDKVQTLRAYIVVPSERIFGVNLEKKFRKTN